MSDIVARLRDAVRASAHELGSSFDPAECLLQEAADRIEYLEGPVFKREIIEMYGHRQRND